MIALPSRHRHGCGRLDTEQKMGLAILIVGLALFLAPHVFTAFRERAGGRDRAHRRERLQDPLFAHFAGRARADRLWLCAATARPDGSTSGIRRPGRATSRSRWCGPRSSVLSRPTARAASSACSSIRCWSASSSGRSRICSSNGDLGSIMLFGAFLAWAVFDRISLKRRTDPGAPPIPVGGVKNDVIAVVGGTVLYLLLGWLVPSLCDRRSRVREVRPCRRRTRSSG